MKKMLQILAVLFISTLLLGACSSDDSEPSEEIDNGTTEANDDETNESAETEEDNTEEKIRKKIPTMIQIVADSIRELKIKKIYQLEILENLILT